MINTFFLRKRLKRVNTIELKRFIGDELKLDTKLYDTQDSLVEKIISLQSNNIDPVFNEKFNDFIRDYIISAKESVYLLELETNIDSLINWINLWDKVNGFEGWKHTFYLNEYKPLNNKTLNFEDNNNFSLPIGVIFIIAKSNESTTFANGLELTENHTTTEFEIVFRANSNIIEIRGQYNVIRDFVNSSDKDNSTDFFSKAESLFIGDEDEDTIKNKNISIKPISKVIKIEKLKKILEAKYLNISAPTSGSKLSRIKCTVEELDNYQEESHPIYQSLINDALINQDKSKLLFTYKGEKYSFDITKKGGLNFKQNLPEEVITYIIYKIKKSFEVT